MLAWRASFDIFDIYVGYSREDFLGNKLWEIGPFIDITASKLGYYFLMQKKNYNIRGQKRL